MSIKPPTSHIAISSPKISDIRESEIEIREARKSDLGELEQLFLIVRQQAFEWEKVSTHEGDFPPYHLYVYSHP